MLKKVLNFNDVSKQLLDSVPKLKKGESVTFKSHLIKPDLTNPLRFSGPYIDNILVKDVIWDEAQSKYVDIAFVEPQITSKGDVVPVFGTIKFTAPSGTLTLTGGKAKDEYMYYFLMLTNQNTSNEKREEGKPGSFFLINQEADAKAKRKNRNKMFDALTKATSMSAEEVRDFVAAAGADDKQELEVLREFVEAWAEKDPEDFLKKTMDVEITTKATVKRALDQGVIKFDKVQLLFSWGNTGEPIIHVARTQDNDHIREFVNTILTDKRYEKVLPAIKRSLKK